MSSQSPFKWLFLINFSISLGVGITDAFFSVYLFSLGARGFIFTLPVVIYSLVKIFLTPLMGAYSDRNGRQSLIVGSIVLYLLVSICFLATTNLIAITMLRALQGISCAMFRPVMVSLVSQSALPASRGRLMGTFDMSFFAALALGPLLGGIILDSFGFRGLFSALMLLCCVALIASITMKSNAVESEQSVVNGTHASTLKQGITLMKHEANMRGLIIFIFGKACGISAISTFLPVLLKVKLGLNNTQAGIVMASSTVIITLMLFPFGKLADLVSRRRMVLVGGTAVPMLYFLIPVATDFSQALLLFVVIGFFSVLSQPASSALLIEEGGKFGMGLTVGTFNSALNMGLVSGPLIGAAALSSIGLTAVFYVAGILGLCGILLFFEQTMNTSKTIDATDLT